MSGTGKSSGRKHVSGAGAGRGGGRGGAGACLLVGLRSDSIVTMAVSPCEYTMIMHFKIVNFRYAKDIF